MSIHDILTVDSGFWRRPTVPTMAPGISRPTGEILGPAGTCARSTGWRTARTCPTTTGRRTASTSRRAAPTCRVVERRPGEWRTPATGRRRNAYGGSHVPDRDPTRVPRSGGHRPPRGTPGAWRSSRRGPGPRAHACQGPPSSFPAWDCVRPSRSGRRLWLGPSGGRHPLARRRKGHRRTGIWPRLPLRPAVLFRRVPVSAPRSVGRDSGGHDGGVGETQH